MELYVKMTDEEYEEYKEYIKNKGEYIKKSDASLYDVIKDFDYVNTEYNPVYDIQLKTYRHKTLNIELLIRRTNYSKEEMTNE